MIYLEGGQRSTNAPVQAGSILNPVLQPSHLEAPSLGHLAPDDAMPFGHTQMLATHLVRSRLTLQPVLQLDTKHPAWYVLAFATLHALQTVVEVHSAKNKREHNHEHRI